MSYDSEVPLLFISIKALTFMASEDRSVACVSAWRGITTVTLSVNSPSLPPLPLLRTPQGVEAPRINTTIDPKAAPHLKSYWFEIPVGQGCEF